jgi:small nuclear ribonucleoprotein (snRNP)-like protein
MEDMLMKVIILSLLTTLLGVLIFLNISLNNAKTTSNQIEKEYLTYQYTITEVDQSGYFGEGEDGQRIYIKKENVNVEDNLKLNDRIIVYFEKDNIKDGLVKVEKDF